MKLNNFVLNENPIPFECQNDGYEAMDEDSEEDFVQMDVEVSCHFVSNNSHLKTFYISSRPLSDWKWTCLATFVADKVDII